jgi:GTP cyclohydrolase IA
LARPLQAYAWRRQIQERLREAIDNTLGSVLGPQGVAVVVEASRWVRSRGVLETDATMVTSRMLAVFRDRPETRQEFMLAIGFHRSMCSGNLSF